MPLEITAKLMRCHPREEAVAPIHGLSEVLLDESASNGYKIHSSNPRARLVASRLPFLGNLSKLLWCKTQGVKG